MTHKKLKIILSIVVSIFVVIVIAVVGGVWYMNNKFNQDMIRIANSEKAKKYYKQGLINLDKYAFTSKSKIKSYKIDQNSISHNPMGGIDVTLIINNDKKLTDDVTLNSEDNGETFSDGPDSISAELSNIAEEESRK